MSAGVQPMHEAAIRQYAKQLRLPARLLSLTADNAERYRSRRGGQYR